MWIQIFAGFTVYIGYSLVACGPTKRNEVDEHSRNCRVKGIRNDSAKPSPLCHIDRSPAVAALLAALQPPASHFPGFRFVIGSFLHGSLLRSAVRV